MLEISTVDMHTGGEPVRVIVGGFPELDGETILDRRRDAMDHHDDLRRLLMLEPRGHYDMYGALLLPPDDPEADLAVLFMHNEGWSTMCGHATIALGRFAVDNGIVPRTPPTTTLSLQVPSGVVSVSVDTTDEGTGAVRYTSMPSFLALRDVTIQPEGLAPLTVDVAYGGAFYALANLEDVGLSLTEDSAATLRTAGTAITDAVNAVAEITHPEIDEMGFLYGTILIDDPHTDPSSNVCVFADAQIDRSPTGSGVQARMAQQFARGDINIGEMRRFRSIIGSEFSGRVVEAVIVGEMDAVTVEVGGRAFYTGESRFTVEDDDELRGFVVT